MHTAPPPNTCFSSLHHRVQKGHGSPTASVPQLILHTQTELGRCLTVLEDGHEDILQCQTSGGRLRKFSEYFVHDISLQEFNLLTFSFLEANNFDPHKTAKVMFQAGLHRKRQNLNRVCYLPALIPVVGYNTQAVHSLLGIQLPNDPGSCVSTLDGALPSVPHVSKDPHANWEGGSASPPQQQQHDERGLPSDPAGQNSTGEMLDEEEAFLDPSLDTTGARYRLLTNALRKVWEVPSSMLSTSRLTRSGGTTSSPPDSESHISESMATGRGSESAFQVKHLSTAECGAVTSSVSVRSAVSPSAMPSGVQRSATPDPRMPLSPTASAGNCSCASRSPRRVSVQHSPSSSFPDPRSTGIPREKSSVSAGQNHHDSATTTGGFVYMNEVLQPIVTTIRKHVHVMFHYWDKQGRPVLYVRLEHLSCETLLEELSQLCSVGVLTTGLLVLYLTYVLEIAQLLIRYNHRRFTPDNTEPEFTECRSKSNRWESSRITSCTMVFSCDTTTSRSSERILRKIVKVLFQVSSKYYPSLIHRVYVTSCPAAAQRLYRSLRRHLDASTRDKIVFCNPKDPLELWHAVEKQWIPPLIGGGGECNCPHCLRALHSEESSSTSNVCTTPVTAGDDVEENREAYHHPIQRVSLQGGKSRKYFFGLQAGEEVVWDFRTDENKDIQFTVRFASATQGDITMVIPPTSVAEGSSHYVARTPGTLFLEWKNKSKWFFSHNHLILRVGKV